MIHKILLKIALLVALVGGTIFLAQASKNVEIAAGPQNILLVQSDGRVHSIVFRQNSATQNWEQANATRLELENIVQVYTAGGCNFAVTNGGDLYAWGDNSHGQLGTSSIYTDKPQLITTGVKKVVCDGKSTFILKQNGDLYVCGDNSQNQHKFQTPVTTGALVFRANGVGDVTVSNGKLALNLNTEGLILFENNTGKQLTHSNESIDTIAFCDSLGGILIKTDEKNLLKFAKMVRNPLTELDSKIRRLIENSEGCYITTDNILWQLTQIEPLQKRKVLENVAAYSQSDGMYAYVTTQGQAYACFEFGQSIELDINMQPQPEERVNFAALEYKTYSPPVVYIDDKKPDFDVPPMIIDGRTMVPMRAIFQALGLSVDYNTQTQTATGSSRSVNVVFKNNSKTAYINGASVQLDVAPVIINSRMLVPLRFLSENCGYNVVWVDGLILISKQDIVEWRPAGYERIEPYYQYREKYINGLATGERVSTDIPYSGARVTKYSADGAVAYEIPEFFAGELTGFTEKSPYLGKTYYINNRLILNDLKILNPQTNGFYPKEQLQSKTKYIKVSITGHLVNQELTQIITGQSAQEYDLVCPAGQALFKVRLNDGQEGYLNAAALLSLPGLEGVYIKYGVLTDAPESLFNFSQSDWESLRDNKIWQGMTMDMLQVRMCYLPDSVQVTQNKNGMRVEWTYSSFGTPQSKYTFTNGVLTGYTENSTVWGEGN